MPRQASAFEKSQQQSHLPEQLDPARQRYRCTARTGKRRDGSLIACGSTATSNPARTVDPRYVLAHCSECHKITICVVETRAG